MQIHPIIDAANAVMNTAAADGLPFAYLAAEEALKAQIRALATDDYADYLVENDRSIAFLAEANINLANGE